MIRLKLSLAVTVALLLTALLGIAAIAQDTPAPYAGAKNPLPWDDASAQQAGKKLYVPSCQGCHGARGESLPGANFSAAAFSDALKNKPDNDFWILSEGRMDRGMPPFKSSLSEEQRWQVIIYMSTLSQAAPAPVAASAPKPAVTGTQLKVVAPKEVQAGRPITFTAYVLDSQGKPVPGAPVTFFLKADFFANGLMEIGDAATNQDGIAVLRSASRESGSIQAIARYQGSEALTSLTVTAVDKPFYETEVGIKMPSIGPGVFVAPAISEDVTGVHGPPALFRLPGGTISWLLLLVAAVLFIWSTYFVVVYQVVRITGASTLKIGNARAIPIAAMVAVALIGIFLAIRLLTGPYSHLNLIP